MKGARAPPQPPLAPRPVLLCHKVIPDVQLLWRRALQQKLLTVAYHLRRVKLLAPPLPPPTMMVTHQRPAWQQLVQLQMPSTAVQACWKHLKLAKLQQLRHLERVKPLVMQH